MTEGTAGLGLTPTPDTGERLTQVRVWDEATRPTRPAPPSGAVYSRHCYGDGVDIFIEIGPKAEKNIVSIQRGAIGKFQALAKF